MRKNVVALVVLLAMVLSVPSWGASFKKRDITDSEFLELCEKGNTQKVIEAIHSGANVDVLNNSGETMLIWAVNNGHADVVNALIEAGAEVNVCDRFGWTSLMLAAKNGYTDIVNALIKAGADVNAKNRDGETPLQKCGDTSIRKFN